MKGIPVTTQLRKLKAQEHCKPGLWYIPYPSWWEAMAGDQEFEVSLGYTVRHGLKIFNKTMIKTLIHEGPVHKS